MEATIKTDHKWKMFKYRNEVPKRILKDQFSYLDEEDDIDGFFVYRGSWYHLSDFMRLEKHNPLRVLGWQGFASDSFFSGVAIKISDDGETYQVALVIS